MSGGRYRAPDGVRPPAWVGRAVARRRGAGALARRETTLRELSLSLAARGLVRALAVFVPACWPAAWSVPPSAGSCAPWPGGPPARPRQQAGLLAFLLGAIALAVQILRRRAWAALPQAQRAAISLGLRLLRTTLVARLAAPQARLLRALAALARRG